MVGSLLVRQADSRSSDGFFRCMVFLTDLAQTFFLEETFDLCVLVAAGGFLI